MSQDIRAALEALRNGQRQIDEEGVMVGVSRQALHEVLAYLAAAPHGEAQAAAAMRERYIADMEDSLRKIAQTIGVASQAPDVDAVIDKVRALAAQPAPGEAQAGETPRTEVLVEHANRAYGSPPKWPLIIKGAIEHAIDLERELQAATLDIAENDAVIDKLRDQLKAANERADMLEKHRDILGDSIDNLRAQLAAQQADAARYRRLKSNSARAVCIEINGEIHDDKTLDAAIAALQAGGEEQGGTA